MRDIVVIENEHWRIGLVPGTGGAVAFGQARANDTWVDVLRPTPNDKLHLPSKTASFPLVPWSSRIRHGSLLWDGEAYALRKRMGEDFSIHGTAVEFDWEVVEREAHRVVLRFDARGYYGVNWPWDFVARFEYALDGAAFLWRMSIENVDDATFPAGIGHHPYFVRALTDQAGGALGSEAHLQINCEKGYELENGMAFDAAGPLPAHADFREMRELGSTHVDDCLTRRTSPLAASIEYPGVLAVDMKADDLLSHVVVYLPKGQEYFAVEPVSNAADGFTLHAKGVPDVGVFTVDPGATTTAEFTLTLRD